MAESELASMPYCGAPPLPGELAGRWNLDPLLLATLAAAALLYALAARRSPSLGPAQRRAFAAGGLVLVLVLVSPLCALGVALFAAREAQHLLLALVAAPLLQLAGPARNANASARAAAAAGALFAGVLWAWHVPAAYAATFGSTAVYWAMHGSLLASALALWGALLRADLAVRSALGIGTALQMALLGALLCFAPTPLYAAHATTTAAWGLSPLADQQLAGLLCWVPGSAVLLAALLASTSALLRETPRGRCP
jgi:putative membrane protein